MDTWIPAYVFLTLNIVCSGTYGFRFQYNRRYKTTHLKYTPYAYNSYIPLSSYQGWKQSSSYVKYVPEVRHSRTYKFYRGDYTHHINMYYAMASSEAYKNRRISEDALVCTNYDANDYGDVMGMFTCPNAWEPSNFTTCCGQDYAEFCCDKGVKSYSWQTILGAVAGILVAGIVVIIVVLVCLRKRKRREKAQEGRSSGGQLNLASRH